MISKLTKKVIFLISLTLSLPLIFLPQVFAEDNPSYSDNIWFISSIVEKEHPQLHNDDTLAI